MSWSEKSLGKIVWEAFKAFLHFDLALLFALLSAVIAGLSLLPLACLLLVLPAILPEESPLGETSRPTGSWWSRWRVGRRIFAVLSSFALLVALIAISTELVSHLPLKQESFASDLGKMIVSGTSWNLENRLPPTLINQWHLVLLCVYLTDLFFLFVIGRVPLKYNVVNLVVRARTTLMTAVAFTVVVGLLVILLSFVNGVNALTEATGHPGNVFVLSDAATDEIFSNLSYGDLGNLRLAKTNVDENGNPLPRPVGVKTATVNGQTVYLESRETYSVVNMAVPKPSKDGPNRRFIQLRAIYDPEIARIVHNIELHPGGRWFSDVGSKGGVVECVIGEGLAGTLGEDRGTGPLRVDDTFELMDSPFRVVGIMKSEGSTFGSELWGLHSTLAERTKKTSLTTIVLRLDEETGAGARAFARYLEDNFKSPRLSAKPEQKYYADLAKSNKQFFYAILVVAIIMAIGGIFGIMNTMYATISQRTKDIGVMRILGFKRWQILVSFMLETLVIALVGGLLGCLLGSFADNLSAKSIVSAGPGGGGGKSVFLKLTVGTDVLVCGLLFTFVMGRLGGLLPSLSAMRLKILDTLR